MFQVIKEIFTELLTNVVNASSHTKFVSLSNQKCTTQPTLINLRPNEYPFVVNPERCAGSCNTLNALSNKVCVPNKTEDLNLSVFNMILGKNVAKTLAKHISCECKCKFDGRKCNSNQKWNNDKCRCKCKNKKKHPICKKDYICNPTTCSFENGKY